MTVRVREARTSAELDNVFRLRHQVFVDEEHYMQQHADARIADRFDAYPTSTNIIALVDDQIVGSIRFMKRSPAGISTDEFYDYGACIEPEPRDGASGMLVVARSCRATPRLVTSLMSMGYLWAASQGITRLFGTINPERLAAFQATGYRQVAPQFHHSLRDLDVIPMTLEMASISRHFADFIRQHQSLGFPCPGERQFHAPGEIVIPDCRPDDATYRIVLGHAAVINKRSDTIGELGPGDVFGQPSIPRREYTAHASSPSTSSTSLSSGRAPPPSSPREGPTLPEPAPPKRIRSTDQASPATLRIDVVAPIREATTVQELSAPARAAGRLETNGRHLLGGLVGAHRR